MCTRPIPARKGPKTPERPSGIHFNELEWREPEFAFEIACGGCRECLRKLKRDWSVRVMHTLQDLGEGCFVTVTYNDENLPWDMGLEKDALQRFLKRLRKRFPDNEIKYLAVGEYGGRYLRPHYHLCILGLDLAAHPLAVTAPATAQGKSGVLKTVPVLDSLWPYGFHTVGPLNEASAAYTAAYTVKKLERKAEDYLHRSYDGHHWTVAPEFHLHSRRPGLGMRWLERYHEDVYGTVSHPKSQVMWRGNPVSPPLAYDRWLKEHDPRRWRAVKKLRMEQPDVDSNLSDRYFQKARETILESKERLFGQSGRGDPGVQPSSGDFGAPQGAVPHPAL